LNSMGFTSFLRGANGNAINPRLVQFTVPHKADEPYCNGRLFLC
jgi:hypothetical protein